MKKKISIFCLTILLVLSCVFVLSACTLNPNTEVERFNFSTDVLKVGIVSDSQLPKDGTINDTFAKNLEKSLEALKKRGANMILFAGDIGDLNHPTAYNVFNQITSKVFKNNKDIIIQTIMGNHDYWENGTAANCRKVYKQAFGKSPWTHYVVNGYHFIGASPVSGIMDNGYGGLEKWLRKHIELAIAENPNNPVFVMTHNSARNTVYGSEDWGDKQLYDILKDYEQVVNMSGHLHYSLLDERSIHQKDFTSFATQSVSYTEMEIGKINGTIPPAADITPMGYMMEISKNKVDIHRLNFGKDSGIEGEEGLGIEEKANMLWTIPIPVKKANFTYTENRNKTNSAPEFVNFTGESVKTAEKTILKFSAGKDDDFVHSYKLVWDNGKKTTEQFYFSDFYNGISSMKNEVNLEIEKMKNDTYNVKIYAVDSWGATSKNFIEIKNVTID